MIMTTSAQPLGVLAADKNRTGSMTAPRSS